MISPELLKIMCCPETHQPLKVADDETVKKLNSSIQSKTLSNRAGSEKLLS